MDSQEPVTETPAPQAPVSQPAPASAPAPSFTTGAFDGPIALTKFAWNFFTKQWKPLALILVVPAVLYALAIGLFATKSAVGGILGFIVYIAFYVFIIAAVPATIQAVHRLATDPGTAISAKAQYRFGFSVFWSFILVSIISGLVTAGSATLLLIPAIFVMIATVVYKYSFVIDGKRGFSALTESFALVRGRWWKVFGRFLFMMLIMLVIEVVIVLLGMLFALLPQVLSTILVVIMAVIAFLLVWTFIHAYLYRLYASLKESRAQNVPTSTFKGWLIGFLCVGILTIVISLLAIPSIILIALNTARLKGLEAQQNANMSLQEIQSQIDAENLNMIEGTGTQTQQ